MSPCLGGVGSHYCSGASGVENHHMLVLNLSGRSKNLNGDNKSWNESS
jgi:hypothetical protein